MNLSHSAQESLLAILLYDPERAPAVEQLVPPDDFDPIFADVAHEAVAHRRRWGEVPGEHALDLFEQLRARRPDDEAPLLRLFDSLQVTRESINREFVVRQASVFARYQRTKRAAAEVVRQLKRDDEEGLDLARATMADALRPDPVASDGPLRLTDLQRSLRFLDEEYRPLPTAIPEVDQFGLGPARKRLHLLMALLGRGKSWWLVWLARAALQHGYRVLYVTLELDEIEVAQRVLQALFSIRKRRRPVRRVKFEVDERGTWVGQEVVTMPKMPHLEQPDIEKVIRRRIERSSRRLRRLLIKEYPVRGVSPSGLDGYLDVLDQSEGFIPDLLLVDYAGIMAPDERYAEKRLQLGSIGEGLRSIAQRRNIAVASVCQSNRLGVGARRLTEEHVGEDFSLFQTADQAFTWTQTEAEEELNLGRIFTAKGRTDRARFEVIVNTAFDIGQFCVASARVSKAYSRTMVPRDGDQ